MGKEKIRAPWPPPDGREYVQSEEFGSSLLNIAERLTESYRHMDFTDAVSQLFTWFEARLNQEPDFINERRFPTVGSFTAYLRQAMWNAGRLAERKRATRHRIEALSAARPIVSREMGPDMRDQLLDAIERLPEPMKTIFTKAVFEEEDMQTIASIYDLSLEEVMELYIQALDEIGRNMNGHSG